VFSLEERGREGGNRRVKKRKYGGRPNENPARQGMALVRKTLEKKKEPSCAFQGEKKKKKGTLEFPKEGRQGGPPQKKKVP